MMSSSRDHPHIGAACLQAKTVSRIQEEKLHLEKAIFFEYRQICLNSLKIGFESLCGKFEESSLKKGKNHTFLVQ